MRGCTLSLKLPHQPTEITVAKPPSIQVRANCANKILNNLPNHHVSIPLGDIFTACTDQELIPLQEDGTRWDGLLCGREGRALILLGMEQQYNEYKEIGRVLVISWYKMPLTGNYEIVCYVS